MSSIESLLECLRQAGLLKQEVSMSLFEEGPEGPIAVLSQLGMLDEMAAIRAICEKLTIDYIDLGGASVQESLDLSKYARLVKADFCWKNRLIPIFEDEYTVVIACANPFDHEAIKSLEFQLSKTVLVFIAEEAKIVQILDRSFERRGQEIAAMQDRDGEESGLEGDDIVFSVDPSDTSVPAIVRLANKILYDAYLWKSSDIHLEPQRGTIKVRFRVDGEMRDLIDIPKRLQGNLTNRFKAISGMDIVERRRPQDGRLSLWHKGNRVDVRASSVPTPYGEKLVFRIPTFTS